MWRRPDQEVRSLLRTDAQKRFIYWTWDALHEAMLCDDPALAQLGHYPRTSSAHYGRPSKAEQARNPIPLISTRVPNE